MLATADALGQLLAAARRVDGTERIDTLDALGRVLAADVVSPLDIPPMHTSSMDGYAVRAADLAGASEGAPIALKVSQRIPAGARRARSRHGGAHLHRCDGAARHGHGRHAGDGARGR